ncbi:Trp biosynthesis-associated membrane protein [Rothia aerolata]|uniref:Trp biosynthesis-associated membrane protein n=1 Tax=Rothia aerolata TaxID=1812262 RepID=A0A917MPW2_9MICC|nr:Trp biosynthesis-associated membrane protein [Rothia aerolata]GGH56967.1 hypothetical protein GCM10007359_01620 [Rothia aerolata]
MEQSNASLENHESPQPKKQGWAAPGRVMLLMVATAAIAFGTTLPTWITAQVHTSLSQANVAVAGSDAAPAVSSLALVALAGGLAIRIVGPKARLIVAAVVALAAVGMGFSVLQVLGNPDEASMTEVGKATGMVGSAADYTFSSWPWIALVCALLILLAALWAAVASRKWPQRRKYERGRTAAGQEMDEIDTWDSLTDGVDPTR